MRTIVLSDSYILEQEAAVALDEQDDCVIECLNALLTRLDEQGICYEAHLEPDDSGFGQLLVYLLLGNRYTYEEYFTQVLPWLAEQKLECRQRIVVTPLCVDNGDVE